MRKYKWTPSNILIDGFITVALIAIALLCLLPMVHVLMSSFSDYQMLSVNTKFLFWPVGKPSLEGYRIVFGHELLWRSYLNTVIYAVSSTIIGLILTYIAGYVISQRDLMFKTPIILFLLITIFFNGGVIPFYIVVNSLGLINTPLALILPTSCSAFNIILMRNGMTMVPESVAESARIDGAGHIRVMTKIYLPLTMSTLAVIAMFSMIGQWNSWFHASIFISAEARHLYPLQLIIRDILINSQNSGMSSGSGISLDFYRDLLNATAIIVATAPILVAYPFIQKYFERGFILGGVKG